MDFTAIDSALNTYQSYGSTSSVPAAVSMKMLEVSMDQSQTTADAMVQMMENSVYPHLGGNIDVSV